MTRTLPTTVRAIRVNLDISRKPAGGGYFFELSANNGRVWNSDGKEIQGSVRLQFYRRHGVSFCQFPAQAVLCRRISESKQERKIISTRCGYGAHIWHNRHHAICYAELHYIYPLVGFTESTATASPATVTTALYLQLCFSGSQQNRDKQHAPTQALHVTGKYPGNRRVLRFEQ